MQTIATLFGKPAPCYVYDGRGAMVNRLRYIAQSILYGEIDDTYYVPTEKEAKDIVDWRSPVK